MNACDLHPPAPPPCPGRAYTPPAIALLGTAASATAGPIPDGGAIDQLVGGVGGFRVPDSTS